jgi:hypothetical protein
MLFSSLSDPVELARAQAALEAAWQAIRPEIPQDHWDRERARLAYILSALAAVAEDEDELTQRALARYRNSGGQGRQPTEKRIRTGVQQA